MTSEIAVIIASADRPELLAQAVECCAEQDGVDFDLVVSVPNEQSLPDGVADLAGGLTVVEGVRGLAAQRNLALRAVPDARFVAFFDDDALPRPDYLSEAMRFFDEHPDVAGLTGQVLLDGAVSGEIPLERARAELVHSATKPLSAQWHPTTELYGCNFVIRMASARELRFDERLPLYSWLEDRDFACRLRPRGRLANVQDCVVVHRAAASGGRRSHLRLGYSQVMNPIYLWRKGSFSALLALRELFRPVAKNVALSVAGGSSSWRRVRLRGNILAARDTLRGRITPERIVELS